MVRRSMVKRSFYRVEWQIETVSKNSILEGSKAEGFDLDGIHFEHWDFNVNDGWVGNKWLAKADIEEQSFGKAVNVFYHKLGEIIPKISFVGQCYIDFVQQPYFVLKKDSDVAYFCNIYESRDSGLMFRENEFHALKLLLKKKSIPEEFFLYWNDAVNTIGYNAKLLIMFAALEALVKHKMGESWEHKKKLRNDFREKIIGKRLLEVFYSPGHPKDGLRNRLNHGEYLLAKDTNRNYVEMLHKKILRYFNNKVFRKKIIHVDVKNPQRHILPQKRNQRWGFIKARIGITDLSLKKLVGSLDCKTFIPDLKKYEYVSSKGYKGY